MVNPQLAKRVDGHFRQKEVFHKDGGRKGMASPGGMAKHSLPQYLSTCSPFSEHAE